MLEYANKKIAIWKRGSHPEERTMRNSMKTEQVIKLARSLLDENDDIVLVECFGDFDNGGASREIRFYSEGQWQ